MSPRSTCFSPTREGSLGPPFGRQRYRGTVPPRLHHDRLWLQRTTRLPVREHPARATARGRPCCRGCRNDPDALSGCAGHCAPCPFAPHSGASRCCSSHPCARRRTAPHPSAPIPQPQWQKGSGSAEKGGGGRHGGSRTTCHHPGPRIRLMDTERQ